MLQSYRETFRFAFQRFNQIVYKNSNSAHGNVTCKTHYKVQKTNIEIYTHTLDYCPSCGWVNNNCLLVPAPPSLFLYTKLLLPHIWSVDLGLALALCPAPYFPSAGTIHMVFPAPLLPHKSTIRGQIIQR